jgi:uncharacterized membrane protein
VLVFSMLESTAVAAAFFYYARHVADHERIVLVDHCLTVEQVQGGEICRTQLDSRGIRVIPPQQSRELIRLEAHETRVDVGRFVTAEKRREVAQDLRRELAAEGIAAYETVNQKL